MILPFPEEEEDGGACGTRSGHAVRGSAGLDCDGRLCNGTFSLVRSEGWVNPASNYIQGVQGSFS